MLAPSMPTMANVAEGDTMLLHHDDEDEMQRLEHEIIMLCHDQYYDPASTAAADKYEDLVEQIISFCETDDMDKIQLPRYQLKQQETAAGVAESTSMHDSLVTGKSQGGHSPANQGKVRQNIFESGKNEIVVANVSENVDEDRSPDRVPGRGQR